jgi:hypothetical protein
MGTATVREGDAPTNEATPGALPGDPGSAWQPPTGAPIPPEPSVDVDAVWERAETMLNLAHHIDREARRCRHTAQRLENILRAARSRRRSAWACRTGVSPDA